MPGRKKALNPASQVGKEISRFHQKFFIKEVSGGSNPKFLYFWQGGYMPVMQPKGDNWFAVEMLQDYVAIHYLASTCPSCNNREEFFELLLGKIPVVATMWFKAPGCCEAKWAEELMRRGVRVIYEFDCAKNSLPRTYLEFEAKYFPTAEGI